MIAQSGSREARGVGFERPFEASEARRQLRLSIGLVTMLSIGILSAAVAVGGHPLSAKQDEASSRLPVTMLQAETKAVGAKTI